jgi:hypothetical protein
MLDILPEDEYYGIHSGLMLIWYSIIVHFRENIRIIARAIRKKTSAAG